MKKKIVVIGAGPAGITAAHELLSRKPDDYDVTILEETEAVGGISRTVAYRGNRMDIGGHRFFSKSERVNAWWRGRMPMQGAPALDDKLLGRPVKLEAGGPDPEREDRVMLRRRRISRIYYHGHFMDYPITLKMSTVAGVGFFTMVRAGFSYLKTRFRKLPETSLENFYINRFGRVLYGIFFEGYTEKLWGRHPSEISADWGAQRVKGLSISAVLKDIFLKLFPFLRKGEVETSLIEEFSYPKYGPGQLWETAAEEAEAMGAKLLMRRRVDGLRLENGAVSAVLCGGETYPADAVISSMPVRDLIAAFPGEDVPQNVAQAAADLPYRDFVTIGLYVPRLALKNKTDIPTLGGIVPDCWIYVQDAGVKLGRIQIFNNWSPYLVEDPEHRVWIGLEYFCREGDAFWNLSDEEAVSFAVGELSSMGIIAPGDVLASHRERVKKAYPAYFDGYAHMPEIIRFLDDVGNLYCVGRNGQHRYNNMDHSMLTAFEAAACILEGRRDKRALWQVNAEKTYQESGAVRADAASRA